jgi:hypothetical protein
MMTRFRYLLVCLGLGSGMLIPLLGQESPKSTGDAFQLVSEGGLPNDWTSRYVVFPTSQDTDKMSVSRKDPRYWLQQLRRRGSQATGSFDAADAAAIAAAQVSNLDDRKLRGRESRGEIQRSLNESMPVIDELSVWPRRTPLGRDWSQSLGVTSTGTIHYPAKFSFSTANPSPDCVNDYVVVTQSGGGGTFPGTFNVIGFNNLYVSTAGGAQFCFGTAPNAIFEYNASTAAGAMNGAPALSLDGTLIAFVETASAANGGAVFHVLKWHSGDVQNIESAFPSAFNTSMLANCAANGAIAPCEYSLQYTPSALRKTADRTAPFIDYSSDTAYLTDDGGNVYAITPVFNASPSSPPAVAAGWPINVGSAVGLLAPVYDFQSKNIFVGSILGTEYFIKTAASTTGACLAGSPPCVGSPTFSLGANSAMHDGTVVDSTHGRVFFTVRRTGVTPGTFLVQADTQLSAASIVSGTIGTVGTSAVYSGTPDNNFFVSISLGKFYVCGVDVNSDAQLYAFGLNGSGVMNPTPVGGPLQLGDPGSTGAICSTGPTENFNQSNGKDWLFTGLGGRCAGAAAGTTGCVMSLDITTGFPAAVSSQLVETHASSGIIVDNETDATSSRITTDIYFHVTGPQSCLDYRGTLHTDTCLVSATQSGLQ